MIYFSWAETERQWDEVVRGAAAEVGDQAHSLPDQAAPGGEAEAPGSHGSVQQLQDQLCQELCVWSRFFKPKYKHTICKFDGYENHMNSAGEIGFTPLQVVQIYFDTATFDEIEKDVKVILCLLKITATIMWRWQWRQPWA